MQAIDALPEGLTMVQNGSEGGTTWTRWSDGEVDYLTEYHPETRVERHYRIGEYPPRKPSPYIEPHVLAKLARELLTEYGAIQEGTAAGNDARAVCAFRALGMLQAFVEGYEHRQAAAGAVRKETYALSGNR